jgi:hypothetical protein
MIVGRPIRSEEPIEQIVNDAEKKIEQLIYEFVYQLASPAPEVSKEFSYYCEILSKDDRFMKVYWRYMKIDTKASKEAMIIL